jgi:hypothetical protein
MPRAPESPPDERHDTAGRVTQTSTALAGITGSQPVPATKAVYVMLNDSEPSSDCSRRNSCSPHSG